MYGPPQSDRRKLESSCGGPSY